ncbi:EutN/CcmL family microcompartment protein [Bacillus shivajii]|uniref:EutN/CcmL family microcompartment protein n=1 Tax=Bacillus shivajii TaxID=1983719 RepID=UPI001CFBE1AE|nr:EutN/CcmL family microcompartment protein [Bacillus shivajii]UCZ52762.1 EutN/CcmL family microcompartment protein [Bacillus shivajii]
MFIGKVVGNVVCTHKDESLRGLKLLVVQPLNDDLTPKGKKIIAIDTIGQSGMDDVVYLAKSNESGLPLNRDLVAADAGIMGIIDKYNVNQ